MRVWTPYSLHEESEGAAVYGDNGYVIIGNSRWRAYDAKGKLLQEEKRRHNDTAHAKNFLDCMRSRQAPNADLETVGHPSSLALPPRQRRLARRSDAGVRSRHLQLQGRQGGEQVHHAAGVPQAVGAAED